MKVCLSNTHTPPQNTWHAPFPIFSSEVRKSVLSWPLSWLLMDVDPSLHFSVKSVAISCPPILVCSDGSTFHPLSSVMDPRFIHFYRMKKSFLLRWNSSLNRRHVVAFGVSKRVTHVCEKMCCYPLRPELSHGQMLVENGEHTGFCDIFKVSAISRNSIYVRPELFCGLFLCFLEELLNLGDSIFRLKRMLY